MINIANNQAFIYKTYSVPALTDSNAGGGRFLTKGIHKN